MRNRNELKKSDNDIFQIKGILEKSSDNKWIQDFVYWLRKFFYMEYWQGEKKDERYAVQMIQLLLKEYLDFLGKGDTAVEEVLRKFEMTLPFLQRLVISDMKAAYEGDPAAESYMEIIAASSPGLLGVLGKGGTVVMAPSGSPDEVLPLIEEKGVTMTAMVPALIPIFSEILDMDLGYDISSLELLQVGGALLEPAVAQRVCEEWPCKLMQVFGTAEGLICFTDLDDSNEIIINYQGRPISPADEIKIVDNEGEEVGYGEYGELLARGPYTIDGYYKLPEVNKQVITEDGFYRTGDRATYDLVKGLKMGGRIKEQINRAGEKIMPAEIERYLCEHKLIEEAAVIGVPDEELGYKSVAFIKYYREVEKTEKVTRKEISEYFCKLGVAAYKIPDMVIEVEQWPVTSVGKIDKKQLIKIVEER